MFCWDIDFTSLYLFFVGIPWSIYLKRHLECVWIESLVKQNLYVIVYFKEYLLRFHNGRIFSAVLTTQGKLYIIKIYLSIEILHITITAFFGRLEEHFEKYPLLMVASGCHPTFLTNKRSFGSKYRKIYTKFRFVCMVRSSSMSIFDDVTFQYKSFQ
uniref:Uncharacterized protein n=1 Tax=Clytia hemisphaerica TaxID=252671 RepID=A0A7M5XL14_9CNID